jgi:predicted dehydrogenase
MGKNSTDLAPPATGDAPRVKTQTYPTRATAPPRISAPELPYRPQDPKSYRPGIALVGCGAIAKHHLLAYRAAGYRVVAFCDLELARAVARRDEYYPKAAVYANYSELLRQDDFDVVDITTHPAPRVQLIREALLARKHVLSQKPFVIDLDIGEELADLADQRGVLLAVNQNGRWAPHFSYIRSAVAAGLLGDVAAAHFAVHWNHSWTKGTSFEHIRHLILYDYGIHWFDMLALVMAGHKPERVSASFTRSASQPMETALFGMAQVEYEHGQASLVFDGFTPYGRWGTTAVIGDQGTIYSEGIDENHQNVRLVTAEGTASPKLAGRWFNDGFHGTMAELLRAIEEGRQPNNSARNNLKSLALCFAAIASAEKGQLMVPGKVRKIPKQAM